ncbi:hypothetical protein CBR_g37454 [Chara braunii]|uniref:DDE Tnp4 domain-containing protein n=1 Tax=Chara braunii TaxID=69332 RepID=A0A388LN67_CHABU|nr:hypothetical protein CBR_g37454 [Chara braunii]|eukprot:GBG83652.1 hypothetical protein CBR_g37454 [Chara braunii]
MPRLRRRDYERIAVAVMAAAGKMAQDAFDIVDFITGFRSGGRVPVAPPSLASLGWAMEDDDDDGPSNHSLLWLWPTIVDITKVIARASPRWWVMRRSAGLWKDLVPDDDAQDDHYLSLLRMRRSTFNRLLRKVGPLLEREVTTTEGGDHYLSLLRMRRSTFNRLLRKVGPLLEREVTRFRLPLPPDKKLAYALHRWAHGDHHLHSCSGYGLGKTSGLRAIMEVAEAINASYPNAVGFGGYPERHARMQKFKALGFPNCWGCINRMHVYVDKPRSKDGDEYCSGRNNRFSVVAQLVVDADLKILDFCYGFPGTVGDARVLKNTSLYRRALKGHLFLDDVDDPFLVQGDAIPGVPGGYLLGDAVGGVDGCRDYVCDKQLLVEELESAERELEHMYRVLVARGDTISVRMQNGRAVCQTEVTQDSANALRWAAFVADRVRSSRSALQQCCDHLVTRHLHIRRELQRWRRMWEDSRMQHDGAAAALKEAQRERDDARRRCEAAESEVAVARRQAEEAWRLVDDIVRTETPVGKSATDDFCEVFEGLSVKEKGKSVDTALHTGAPSQSVPSSMCPSCKDLSGRLAHMESELVKLEMTNEMLQWPASVWEEMDNDLKNFTIPRKFDPLPGSFSSATEFGDRFTE